MSYGREGGSWWSRNWGWAVGCGCLTAIVAPLALCAGGVGLFVWKARSHDGFTEALALARAHPAVVEALGEPIEPGWTGSFNFGTEDGVPRIDFETTISGPRGTATLLARGTRPGADWTFERLTVVVDGTGERIDLLAPIPGSVPRRHAP